MERMQNEAWLDEINRIVSFHEISDSRYYSAEEHDFWQVLVELVLSGYRVQSTADMKTKSLKPVRFQAFSMCSPDSLAQR